MSSPNEPGYPGPGDPANGSGPNPGASRSGPVTDPGDVPPWQRGAAGRTPRRPAPEPTSRAAGIDDRVNRFISGSSTSATPATPESEGPARNEAYRSEIPDLSGTAPRSVQRPATDRKGGGEPSAPPARSATPTASRVQVGSRAKGPVRASMQIRRVDPWSVLKVSLVLSVAMFFVWMIAVAFLYLVLGGMGVWSKLNSNVGDLLTNTSDTELVSSSAVFGGAALIGLVNIVLLTAMATIGAFIYNLTTDLVGGVEVTLADRD